MTSQIALLQSIAKQSKSGEIDIAAGKLCLEAYEWGRALQLIQQGIDKGNLDDPANAYGLLADIYSRLDKPVLAKEARAQAQLRP